LYLAATRKGASIDDAIYEATTAIGNYQTRGKKLEKWSRIALFLNPAVKAADAEAMAMGIGPGSRTYKGDVVAQIPFTDIKLKYGFEKPLPIDAAKALRYVSKGFVAITLPTIALYYMNQEDPEIERLRKTDAGRRFNFIRLGDQVVRVRKPFISGQIFGTAIENYLDTKHANDPVGLRQWLETMMEDLPLNVMPTGLGAAFGLVADKEFQTGMPITGQGLAERTPAERERSTTSEPARALGQAMGPVSENAGVPEWLRRAMSPVGIDFLVRSLGGSLAQDAMQGLTVAHEWTQENYLRPAAEMPLIRSALANTSTAQALSVEHFYELVQRVDETMVTMNHLMNDPVRFVKFYNRNKAYAAIAPAVRETRTEIGKMRQSLEDVRTAPESVISAKAKNAYRRSVNALIIQRIEFLMNTMPETIKGLEANTR
jgi:hypothetical protein